MAVCSPKSALYCSPLLVPALSPTHVITYYGWQLDATLVVIIKLFLKNADDYRMTPGCLNY